MGTSLVTSQNRSFFHVPTGNLMNMQFSPNYYHSYAPWQTLQNRPFPNGDLMHMEFPQNYSQTFLEHLILNNLQEQDSRNVSVNYNSASLLYTPLDGSFFNGNPMNTELSQNPTPGPN